MNPSKKTLICLAVGIPVVAAVSLFCLHRYFSGPYYLGIRMSVIQQELFNRTCVGTGVLVAVAELSIISRLKRKDEPDAD